MISTDAQSVVEVAECYVEMLRCILAGSLNSLNNFFYLVMID